MSLPPLHLGTQHARSLLNQLRTDIAGVERRTARHASRLRLSPDDQERMASALEAVRAAQRTVERLFDGAPHPSA